MFCNPINMSLLLMTFFTLPPYFSQEIFCLSAYYFIILAQHLSCNVFLNRFSECILEIMILGALILKVIPLAPPLLSQKFCILMYSLIGMLPILLYALTQNFLTKQEVFDLGLGYIMRQANPLICELTLMRWWECF